MTKTYFVCHWTHEFPDEPVDLYTELDTARCELRKVYIFKDGHGEIAGPGVQTGSTFLSPEPCPPLAEIAADFKPREISVEEFEAVWLRYVK